MDAPVLHPASIAPVSGFVAEDWLSGILKDGVAGRQPFRIASQRNGSIVVVPEIEAYFGDKETTIALCHLPRQSLSMHMVGAGELSSIVQGASRPLSELYWHAAYWACDGLLPQGCFKYDVIQLVRWPNLTRLPYDENFMRICALLSRHPSSVMLATRILKISVVEMNRFYSAAYYAGMVKVVNRRDGVPGFGADAPEAPPVVQSKNAGLLGKLFKRLVGL